MDLHEHKTVSRHVISIVNWNTHTHIHTSKHGRLRTHCVLYCYSDVVNYKTDVSLDSDVKIVRKLFGQQ